MNKILFLDFDFDGVLHSEDVYIVNGQPVLRQSGGIGWCKAMHKAGFGR